MINKSCNIGKKTQTARRIAGMLMTGTLAGTLAAGGAGAVPVAAASWQENADYIFDYLTQNLGYSEAAACGIMANIRCESTFNPHAWNAGGGSYGLCQWTGGRYGRLRSWCGSNGYDYTTIDGQLAYLQYELESHYPGVEQHLRSVENNADGAYDAGQYYCYHFEAPASRGSVSVYRGGLASGTFWDSYRPAEWYQVDGVWHYILRDGSYQTQWLTIEDETFYLDKDGNRISGWRTIDGDRYYFDENGVMVTGWHKVNGKNYYFDTDGSLVTGLVHSGDDWYLLDENGNVQASAYMENFAPTWLAAAEERQEETALASAEEAGAGQDESTDSATGQNESANSVTGQVSQAETALASAGETGQEEIVHTAAAPVMSGIGTLVKAETEEKLSSVEALQRAAQMLSAGDESAAAASSEEEEESSAAQAMLAATAALDATTAEAENAEEAQTADDGAEEAAEAGQTADDGAEEVAEAGQTADSAEEAAEAGQTADSAEEAAEAGQTTEDAEKAAESKEESSGEASVEAAESKDTDSAEEAGDSEDEESPEEAGDSEVEESPEEAGDSEEKEIPEEEEKEDRSGSEDLGDEEDSPENGSGYEIQASLAEEDLRNQQEESVDKDSKADETSNSKKEKVEIVLEDDIPEIALDDIHDLVKILKEKEILHAETESGLDITDKVEVSLERVGSGYREYTATFTVEYKGSTDEVVSTVYVTDR